MMSCDRENGEEAEQGFCDSNYLALPSLRMSAEARVSDNKNKVYRSLVSSTQIDNHGTKFPDLR